MRSLPRKIALLAHITFSVGWLGSVLPYLALAITGLSSSNRELVKAAYISMDVIGWYVIVPLSIAALLTGLIQSLATSWGLLRYWWIVAKLLLTGVGVVVLLKHMTVVSKVAIMVTAPGLLDSGFQALQKQLLVHPAGGLALLFVATLLSVFKPWGLTPFARKKDPARTVPVMATAQRGSAVAVAGAFWPRVVAFHALGLLALAVIYHVAAGGMHHH